MSLRQEISVAKCERILVYPYVRLDEDNTTFEEFATHCSKTWGGDVDVWKKRNKHLLGLFGSTTKKLERGVKFKFPQCLVDDANDRFFETVGIPSKKAKMPSPSSVVDNTPSPDNTDSDTSPGPQFTIQSLDDDIV